MCPHGPKDGLLYRAFLYRTNGVAVMKRWGHTEGAGLGKTGDGIVHALTTEHVEKVPMGKPGEQLSKRQLAKQKVAASNMKKRKWVQHATNRGKIVNANEEVRAEEEKSKYGEPGRVVVLQGMVDGVDDVDEDMADEIGEECSKFGSVVRDFCLVHELMEEQDRGEGGAAYGGAPASRPVRLLEGVRRLFRYGGRLAHHQGNGRQVLWRQEDRESLAERRSYLAHSLMWQRARYFDEGRFDAGDRDGELA